MLTHQCTLSCYMLALPHLATLQEWTMETSACSALCPLSVILWIPSLRASVIQESSLMSITFVS